VSGTATFYRAVNMNGAALTINGNAWEANAGVTNFTTNGTVMSNEWMTLSPAASGTLATMLKTWRQHWAFNIAMAGVPNGTYQVYVFVVSDWNNPNPPTVTLTLEGRTAGSYVPGAAGTWRRLGPYTATITDGTINVTANGIVNISGVEVYRNN
jgi:hypothetical protein